MNLFNTPGEGSGGGGRRHHRHRYHLRRILPPTTLPTPPPTASAEIATITINPAGVAIAAVSTKSEYSWGSGSVTEGGRAEALSEGAAAGARGRAPNDYSRGSGSVTEGGGRQRYGSERRQVSGTERRTTTLGRRRDRSSRPLA